MQGIKITEKQNSKNDIDKYFKYPRLKIGGQAVQPPDFINGFIPVIKNNTKHQHKKKPAAEDEQIGIS